MRMMLAGSRTRLGVRVRVDLEHSLKFDEAIRWALYITRVYKYRSTSGCSQQLSIIYITIADRPICVGRGHFISQFSKNGSRADVHSVSSRHGRTTSVQVLELRFYQILYTDHKLRR
jgi:hypothetical protein